MSAPDVSTLRASGGTQSKTSTRAEGSMVSSRSGSRVKLELGGGPWVPATLAKASAGAGGISSAIARTVWAAERSSRWRTTRWNWNGSWNWS